MMKNNIGLYIHIPFCVKKCNYCDFLSFSIKDKEMLMEQYIDSVCAELKMWSDKLADKVIDTIFIGGGTPSIIPPSIIDRLFDTINSSFFLSEKLEFSMEANPKTTSSEKFDIYKQAGVNRISFGMQSTIEKELKALGRIHTYEDFLKSYNDCKNAGIDNINIDIMQSIPYQTVDSYKHTLEEVIKLNPNHISSYSLIIEEGTKFYELYKDKPPVDEDTDRLLYELTDEILSKHNYNRYEISNYSKKNFESKHNIKYWRCEDYIGVGLGASSCYQNERFSNKTSFEEYFADTKNKILPIEDKHVLSAKEKMEEFMFLGLRMMEGVSENRFLESFGENIYSIYNDVIEESVREDLLRIDKNMISLTKKGIDLSNYVFSKFLL